MNPEQWQKAWLPWQLEIPGERRTQQPCLTNLWDLFSWGKSELQPGRYLPGQFQTAVTAGGPDASWKGYLGHQCLVNLSWNWLAIWTSVLTATDWGVSSEVTSDGMHCFLKWMAFLPLVLIRCSRRMLVQVTLVDQHALWGSAVPTGLHASSLLVAATLQGSGLLSPCHRLGSR